MEYVTLTNRTSRELKGIWDGKNYEIAANKKEYLPRNIAEAIQRQNPIMGSDDPVTGILQYLLGIEENGDDCSPVEQSAEIELYNRGKYKDAVPVMVIPGNVGMYQVKRNEIASPQPLESTFVKP